MRHSHTHANVLVAVLVVHAAQFASVTSATREMFISKAAVKTPPLPTLGASAKRARGPGDVTPPILYLPAMSETPPSVKESPVATTTASPPAPPRSFGPLYDPLLAAEVTFTSADVGLDGLVRHAEQQCAGNIQPFLPGSAEHLPILEEGAQFRGAWLETQPMGGAMYVLAT